MRLPKNLSDCVAFAHWCMSEDCEPARVARLLVLARKAKRAGEKHCNEGTDATHEAEMKAAEQFETLAAEMGYKVDWPGLWPVLSRGGYDVYLPEVS